MNNQKNNLKNKNQESLEIIDISKIKGISKYNIRKIKPDENLEFLIKSISHSGINLVPIIIDQNYEVVCGQRRYLALKKAGLNNISVIKRNLTPREAVITSFSDGFYRRYLLPADEYEATEIMFKQLGMSAEDIAKSMGVSIRSVHVWARYKLMPEIMSEKEWNSIPKKRHRKKMREVINTIPYDVTIVNKPKNPADRKTSKNIDTIYMEAKRVSNLAFPNMKFDLTKIIEDWSKLKRDHMGLM